MDNGQKLGVAASIVTIGGGILWLLNRGSQNAVVASVPSPAAAANSQTAPAVIGSGPATNLTQYPLPKQNVPSWNSNIGPGNLPDIFVGPNNSTSPSYITYNLPPDGTNLITSTPSAVVSRIVTGAQNVGTLPASFLKALKTYLSSNPVSAPKSTDCGCGCGGASKSCGETTCQNPNQIFGSPAEAALPIRYQSAVDANTTSALQPFKVDDPRLVGAGEGYYYE